MEISNDSEFKTALSFLSSATRRLVAARFAENVLALWPDARVKNAIDTAKRTDITAAELAAAFQSANAVSVESFTRCGHECDWNNQAGHFVAQAVLACLKPSEPGSNRCLGCRDACAHGAHLRDHRQWRRHRQYRGRGAIPHPCGISQSLRKRP